MSIRIDEKVIVVGGGLSGLAAAHTAWESGVKEVLLIDKSSFCGGNSTKATSGINGAGTTSQLDLDIHDNNGIFKADILRGGSKDNTLAEVLATHSGPGIEWLKDKFSLDLSLVSRLGGHSQPRTHRGKAKFPGMTITYALLEAWEDICEKFPKKAHLINHARGDKLITDAHGNVIGIEWIDLKNKDEAGKPIRHRESGVIVIAAGGFGADFGPDSYIQKYRPDLLKLPTTNGVHCTGDGIKMAEDIGAKLVDMEWIQVHPTGLVNPKDVDAKVKFLAAEALRGVGGVLLDKHGNRFSNELGRRDYVTGRMWKSEGPFRLCLNTKASEEILWHIKHYKGRGLMKFYKNCEEMAADSGTMKVENIKAAFDEHNEIDKKMSDPSSPPGPYDAYGGGKTYDKWGKKFFRNGPLQVEDSFHVGIVTPVIHYCMGGSQVNNKGQICRIGNAPINGLYGAGEVNGGIHGENRLGGNALLECVVFGRLAGSNAASSLMRQGGSAL